MNVFSPYSPYSPFFTSFIFLLAGVAILGLLCIFKVLGAGRIPPLLRINFLTVDFNQILQDDVNFSRHFLTLFVAFITTITLTAVLASTQWILLPNATESVFFILHMLRLVLGLAICLFFSRRLPRR